MLSLARREERGATDVRRSSVSATVSLSHREFPACSWGWGWQAARTLKFKGEVRAAVRGWGGPGL